MAEDSKLLDASESGQTAADEVEAPLWSRLGALRDRLAQFEKSAAGRYWAHLSTADFMNSSFAFAALAVLSAFPFLAVTSSVLGGDIRTAIVARMDLNAQATHDVNGLISTGNQAVATLTWISAIVLVLGGIGMASTLSTWYHRIYERTPPKGYLRHLAYQTAGVAAFALYISVEVEVFGKARPVGGRGLVFLLTFVFAVLFWWWSTYMLLYRQVPLRRLFPAGVATGACITGLGMVSSLFFSGQVTSGERSYGPAGVVIALITFLVASVSASTQARSSAECGTSCRTNAPCSTTRRRRVTALRQPASSTDVSHAVVCCAIVQHPAGTRRVHEGEHVRARAYTAGTQLRPNLQDKRAR